MQSGSAVFDAATKARDNVQLGDDSHPTPKRDPIVLDQGSVEGTIGTHDWGK